MLAGLLFTVNARVSNDSLSRGPGLRGMVTARSGEVERLAEAHTFLEQAVSAHLAEVDPEIAITVDLDQRVAVGAVPVAGPGLKIAMADSTQQADSQRPAEAYLVHQQDIDGVISALWAGGAEAVAVQNHRLTSATAIRCVGNVILVAGRVYAPPYLIEAIGPVEAMEQALAESPQVKAYVDAATALGLGWSVTREELSELPAATDAGLSLRYAQAAITSERTGL